MTAAASPDASAPLHIDLFHSPAPITQIRDARVSVAAFVTVACGILIARQDIAPAWVWFTLAALACAAALAARWRFVKVTALTLLLWALAGGWLAQRALTPPAQALETILTQTPTPLSVEGVVRSAPHIEPASHGQFAAYTHQGDMTVTRFELRVDRVFESISDSADTAKTLRRANCAVGALAVRVDEPLVILRAGDRLRIEGDARALAPPDNPGERDSRPFARQRQVSGSIYIPTAALVHNVKNASVFSRLAALPRKAQGAIHHRAQRAIDALTSRVSNAETSALIEALILGEKTDALQDVEQTARDTGLAHILAISGLHIGALAYMTLLALRLAGDRGALEPVIVAAIVALYLIALPARTPALRAGLMILTFLTAEIAGRRYSSLAVLLYAGILTLAWRPMELFSVGFQLSYAIVAGLILLAPRVNALLPGGRLVFPTARTPGRQRRITRARVAAGAIAHMFRQAFVISLCAWLISSPFAASHFGQISPLTPFASAIAVPLLMLILAIGAIALVVGAVVPVAAGWLAWLITPPTTALIVLMRSVDALPLSTLHTPALSSAWTIAVITVIVTGLARVHAERNKAYWCAVAVAVIWTVLLAARSSALPSNVALQLDMFDVGDGACILLRAKDQAMLWDCGSRDVSIGSRELRGAFRAAGGPRISRAIVTHPDMDHYTALPAVAHSVGLRDLFVTDAFFASVQVDPVGPDAFFLSRMRQLGANVSTIAAGDELTLGDVTLRILSPPRAPRPSRAPRADNGGAFFATDNDNSVVALVVIPTETGERTLLLTGDIQSSAIVRLRKNHPDLHVDIMEAPHHGSANADSMAFVQALNPAVVLQSTGPSRLDDERWSRVRQGRTWLATARYGAIGVRVLRAGEIQTRTFIGAASDRWRLLSR